MLGHHHRVSAAEPSTSEYVVLRSQVDVHDSDIPRSVESTWLKRVELETQDYVELLGPAGNLRAYPTERTETAPDGSVAQVYEVPATEES